jgi:transposase InsO family protein
MPGSTLDLDIREEMQSIALEFPRYGYRRITHELKRRGHTANHKRVLALMRELNICCPNSSFKKQTTDSEHGLPVYPNLAKGLQVEGINKLWVADITYVGLRHGFVYLAVVLDVFSRKVVGWELSRRIDTNLALGALQKALKEREGTSLTGLIHHSDQGVQYASLEYVVLLKEQGIQISMSRRGNPYDNAYAESFMKTFKYEEVYLKDYEDYPDAYNNIGPFIDEVYNKKRIHSSIGYLTPEEYEKKGYLYSKVA